MYLDILDLWLLWRFIEKKKCPWLLGNLMHYGSFDFDFCFHGNGAGCMVPGHFVAMDESHQPYMYQIKMPLFFLIPLRIKTIKSD